MNNKQTDGSGAFARAEPAIKFNDLAPHQQREVLMKAKDPINLSAEKAEAHKSHEKWRDAFTGELSRLRSQPLTIRAFFLGIAALAQGRTGKEISELPFCPETPEGSPILRNLVETHLTTYGADGGDSYWDIYYTADANNEAFRTEEARILDETANKMFGQEK